MGCSDAGGTGRSTREIRWLAVAFATLPVVLYASGVRAEVPAQVDGIVNYKRNHPGLAAGGTRGGLRQAYFFSSAFSV